MNNTTAPSFTHLTDLAAERLGGKVIFCTDDFFAEKENLLKPGRAAVKGQKATTGVLFNWPLPEKFME